MIKTRTLSTGQTEIYVENSGGVIYYLTESYPTNFHHRYTRKILTANESISDFKEVTAQEWEAIQAADARYERPSQWLIDTFNLDRNGAFVEERGMFRLHGLWLTPQEAYDTAVYGNKVTGNADFQGYSSSRLIRTNLTPVNAGSGLYCRTYEGLFTNQSNLEVAVLTSLDNLNGTRWNMPGIVTTGLMWNMFNGCTKLHTIIGYIYMVYAGNSTTNAFSGCVNLENVIFNRIRSNLDLRDCGKLSLESLRQSIKYADNNTAPSAVQITVHPDVYAKLTDETNADWNQVLLDAAAKNIVFTTI